MKFTEFKHLPVVVLVAVGLALAGCGGGGSDSTPAASNGDVTPDPAIAERRAISTAIETAQNAVNAVDNDSTDAQVSAAERAVADARSAITAAANVPEQERAANTRTVNTLATQLSGAKSARKTAMDDADEMKRKATTATAKALRAAIMAGEDGATISADQDWRETIPVLSTGDDATIAIPLKKGDSPGSLGSWSGQDYAGMIGSGDAKTTGMTRVYSNPGATKNILFISEAGESIHGWSAATGAPAGDYTVVTTSASQQMAVGGFPTTGTKTYDEDDTVDGSFMGAPGTYKCTADAGCSAIAGTDSINLGDGWTFTPSSGAMVQMRDASYLQFGWWIRKDKDGPTHAGVIYGSGGTTALTATTSTTIDSTALVGPAKYVGKAAGKFAISDALRPAYDNAGHFTADAELNADFKPTGSTLDGIIDNFRLNDGSDDPGWSVELQKAPFNATGSTFGTATDSTGGDRTVWTIDGNKGASSGSWEAQMFDEAVGPANDDSNVPTSVVGSFSSNHQRTHEMVGAFGATKTEE